MNSVVTRWMLSLRYAVIACVAWLAAIVLCQFAIFGQVNVTTYHYDSARTGQNTQETSLTPSTVSAGVNPNQFGRLFSQATDGQIYGQPLYVSNLTIGGSSHNVVFVVTEADSVYAFDADSNTGSNINPLWKVSVLGSGEKAVPSADVSCTNIAPVIGITSTPVIDLTTNTMYVVAKSENNGGGTFYYRLHALDITSGSEKFGGPFLITASAFGFTFDPKFHHNRPGLLLSNGTIYIGFASHCDNSPYHGWVLAYNASSGAQTGVYMSPTTGSFGGGFYGAGVWMSGGGLAGDSSGNIYFATGNGTADGTTANLGDSIVKLSSNTAVTDFFTPADQGTLLNGDIDLGSGGVLLLPDQSGSHPHLLVQAGKEGKIYLVDRDTMTTNNQHYCPGCDPDPIVQEVPNTSRQCGQQNPPTPACPVGGMWSMPAYWNNTVFFWGVGDRLKAFSLSNGTLSTAPSMTSSDTYNYPGSNLSVSANGTTNGIVWSLKEDGARSVLRAHDPGNSLQLLYSSDTNSGRDDAGAFVKFTVPTVVNGKVYVGADSQLSVYGKNPPDFTLSVSPTSQTFPAGGGSRNYIVTVTPINNFNAPVTITLTSLPANTSYSCSPNPVNGGNGSSTCAVTTTASTPIGTANFNINGQGGGIKHTISATLVQPGITIVRPTTGQNPYSCCGVYQNFSSAFDGNLSTAASPLGVSSPSQAAWYGFSYSGSTPTAINLKVSSSYNSGSGFFDGVGLQYSTDAGSTWHVIYYFFARASSRSQQTDVISLPTNTNLANVWVEGFVDGHPPTDNQNIYEIWIEVTHQ